MVVILIIRWWPVVVLVGVYSGMIIKWWSQEDGGFGGVSEYHELVAPWKIFYLPSWEYFSPNWHYSGVDWKYFLWIVLHWKMEENIFLTNIFYKTNSLLTFSSPPGSKFLARLPWITSSLEWKAELTNQAMLFLCLLSCFISVSILLYQEVLFYS